MTKNHLKRIAAPSTWKIKRKKHIWITRPRGPHKLENMISINTLLRDILKYAKTAKEVRDIIFKKGILVDGRRIKDVKYGVGLMDIITLPVLKESYRVILDKKGKLALIGVDEKTKLCRIIGKTVLNKEVQLNLFDGKNIIIEKDNYKVGDTVEIELSSKKIKEHIKFEPGNCCYIIGGSYVGEVGTIKSIEKNVIDVKTQDREFKTAKRYVFMVGKEKPLIKFEK